jgi:hypothetical protein
VLVALEATMLVDLTAHERAEFGRRAQQDTELAGDEFPDVVAAARLSRSPTSRAAASRSDWPCCATAWSGDVTPKPLNRKNDSRIRSAFPIRRPRKCKQPRDVLRRAVRDAGLAVGRGHPVVLAQASRRGGMNSRPEATPGLHRFVSGVEHRKVVGNQARELERDLQEFGPLLFGANDPNRTSCGLRSEAKADALPPLIADSLRRQSAVGGPPGDFVKLKLKAGWVLRRRVRHDGDDRRIGGIARGGHCW